MPHIHEKIDFTASVYIVNENAVLLRKHDKYKIWLVPGGHIELDEDPATAAIREAKEEAGLDITLVGKVSQISEGEGYKELLPPRFMNIHSINETHQHIDLIYVATSKSRDTSQGETEVSEEMRWFTREELDDPKYELRETIKHYAKAALDITSS